MTDIARRVRYTGNGSTKAFPFGFRVFEPAEVGVWLGSVRAAAGYAVTIDEDGQGGTVTFAAAPAAGTVVTLVAEVEPKRVSTFQQAGEFRASVINAELDRIVAVLGQLREAVARRLAPAETDVDVLAPLPGVGARSGRVLAFDGSGQPTAPDAAAARALIGLAAGATGWTSLGISAFAQGLLDDADAQAALTTLGVSAFARTLLDDADAPAARATLGLGTSATLSPTAFAQTILDDPDAPAARASLGLGTAALLSPSAFAVTLLDDPDAATALATLGVSLFAQALLGDGSAAAMLARLGFTAFARSLTAAADAQAFRAAIGLGSGALLSPSSYAETLLAAADAAAARAALGVTPANLGISAFAQTLLDDASASAAQTTLGISSFVKPLLDDADAPAAWATLGFGPIVAAMIAAEVSGGNTVSPFMATVLDDADAAAARATLGVTPANLGISAYAQTLLDDASASAMQTTLGVSSYAQSLLDDASASAAQTTLGFSAFAKTLLDDADAATARATLGLGAAATLNVQATGAGALLREDGNGAWVSGVVTPADAPPQIANNASFPNTRIDVASKTCTADDAGRTTLFSTGALTKRLDAPWAAGTNQGGLDAGSKTANTWYSVWVIATAGRTQDVLFSTSATSPTLPAGYLFKRRIGWIRTDPSGNILPFVQMGDRFILKSVVDDASQVAVPTAGGSVTITAAPGCVAQIVVRCYHATTTPAILVIPTAVTSVAPTTSGIFSVLASSGQSGTSFMSVLTSASSQIHWRANTGSVEGYIRTLGWIDSRGRDA